MMNSDTVKIEGLVNAIFKVPGNKIITLIVDGDEPFIIDINKDGTIGYEDFHKKLFEAKLLSAFSSSGGLIIRQFLPVKVERTMPNGKKTWIPRKNIYGVSIVGGSWKGLTQNEVKQAHCTDTETGKRLAAEGDTSFRSFPIP